MAEIDSNDVMNNLVFLLVFTGDNQPDEIKNRAVAKVKTHPQWESELIRLIQTEWAPEPFQFLAFNDVENPSLLQGHVPRKRTDAAIGMSFSSQENMAEPYGFRHAMASPNQPQKLRCA